MWMPFCTILAMNGLQYNQNCISVKQKLTGCSAESRNSKYLWSITPHMRGCIHTSLRCKHENQPPRQDEKSSFEIILHLFDAQKWQRPETKSSVQIGLGFAAKKANISD